MPILEPTVRAYRAVRQLTEELAEPLSPEDQTAQSMPDVSPTKWHRAHVTWFFETFVLEPHAPGHRPVDPAFRMLFNSYYEGVGPKYPRPQRGVVTRPGAAEIGEYRGVVDAAMEELLGSGPAPEVADLVVLGLHHEQQHQELLLMDIQHVLSLNPLEPVYRPAKVVSGPERPLCWHASEGGVVETGHAGGGFAFDNEGPRHRVFLEPYAVADRLVTNGEWAEFMADGGYRRPELWLSDGWLAVNDQGWEAPLYWRRRDGGWVRHTLGGTRPVEPSEPVCHVSFYEADAFARWAGARLPTEQEWEHTATVLGVRPEDEPVLDLDVLHPRPASSGGGQWFGEVWQWTSSAYLPYPGYRPAQGAVGEYNGKFMSGQMVLRGSSAFTPPGHARSTYRNFFPPSARWAPAGLRLARGARP